MMRLGGLLRRKGSALHGASRISSDPWVYVYFFGIEKQPCNRSGTTRRVLVLFVAVNRLVPIDLVPSVGA